MVEVVGEFYRRIRQEIEKVIVGQKEILEQILVALLVKGHILIEGVPGIAKTLLSKSLAYILNVEFRRVQFTPDLMPSDIVGTNVFDLSSGKFNLRKGPIFTNVFLADEINRTPPKTQSALLEAMEERQVSIDGETYPLAEVFIVIATQNPIEYEGTYPLPEAQLDRFMLKIVMGYPAEDEEKELLRRFRDGFDPHDFALQGLERINNLEILHQCWEEIKKVTISDELIEYLYKLTHILRYSPKLSLGPSPRGSAMLLLASKAKALLEGRDFVIPDDIKAMVYPVFRHRLILRPEIEVEGIRSDDVIRQALSEVIVPR